MLSANFKPKRTAVTSRGFPATAWLSCYYYQSATSDAKRMAGAENESLGFHERKMATQDHLRPF